MPTSATAPHAVALEEQRQAGDVVLVRVGQHDEVDAPVPGRQLRIEDDEQPIGIRSAVDEHPAAGVTLDEDGVALSDIEDGHPQATVRPGRGRQGSADRRGRPGPGARPPVSCRRQPVRTSASVR